MVDLDARMIDIGEVRLVKKSLPNFFKYERFDRHKSAGFRKRHFVRVKIGQWKKWYKPKMSYKTSKDMNT